MKVSGFVIFFLVATFAVNSQNDLDALRYSRTGVNGTARFTAMGGAFGAVGADVSCAAYNPAGLAIFRSGEFSFSAAVHANNNHVGIYNKNAAVTRAYFNFNNFGYISTWLPQYDKESRSVFAITVTQLLNFDNTIHIEGYTNSSSIAKDMLNLATRKQYPAALSRSYEGLGFDTYLLDTSNNLFFSNLDTKRSVKQKRDIVTSGRLNDINLSFGHSYKDKLYFGASLGIPQVRYESTTTHTEADDYDSMRVVITSPTTYSTTYIDGLPVIHSKLLGFSGLNYTEYFKTSGNGYNFKIGGIARVSDMLRIGFYYHTPTYYYLNDAYYNTLSVTFDYDKTQPISKTNPSTQGGGYYKYSLITPSRFGLNAAFIYKKLAVIAMDFESLNYKSARFKSSNVSDFIGANTAIQAKYTAATNLRLGAELNVKPLMLRIGYNMQGSPYGAVFTGDYVRNTISLGCGFRTVNNFYFDFAWLRTTTKEPYDMFKTLDTKAQLKLNYSSFSATLGYKF